MIISFIFLLTGCMSTQETFMKMIRKGDCQRVNDCISKGADVNIKDRDGRTPLYEACSGKSKEIVELLISKGADVNAEVCYDADVPDSVKGKANVPKRRSIETPLIAAIRWSTDDIARLLILHGADVKAKDEEGWTCMHWAADRNNKVISELLISKGADVNARNNTGETPLHLASYDGINGVPALLIASGAHVNEKDNAGRTPLYTAADNGRVEVVRVLISSGAHVNEKDKDGRTPLYAARQNESSDIVKFLKSHGAKE